VRRALLWGSLIAITCLAYQPVFEAGFVWDDNDWVTQNPLVTGERPVSAIWASVERLHYYPVAFSLWRVQYALWGESPFGFHLVNILLHALSAGLLILLLERLRIAAAVWIGFAFALHPLQVESVAWVTEMKNTLSALLLLAAALALVRARSRDKTVKHLYLLALLLFTAAVLTKTAVAVAALLFPLLVITAKRPQAAHRREALWVSPFIAIGALLGLLAVRLEQGLAGRVAGDFGWGFAERIQMAGRACFFYIEKLLLPHPLSFHYPRWSFEAGLAWLWPVAAIALLPLGAVLWRKGYRKTLLGCVSYLVLISPALGLFDVYWFRYSFVADHFAYLASIGILALVVSALHRWLPGSRSQRATIGVCLLLLLTILSWNRAHVWRDAETLWLATVASNPDSWLAHHSLAMIAYERQQPSVAAARFDAAIRAQPSAVESYTGRALVAQQQQRWRAALEDFDHALSLDGSYPQARLGRGVLRAQLGEAAAAIEDLNLFLASNPTGARAHVARARAYAQLGQLDAALADAQTVQAVPEFRALGLEVEGGVVFQGGDRERGCDLLSRACQDGSCVMWSRLCNATDPVMSQ
jgi:tetratricopeptide (TPR) repeat protein